MPVQSDFFLFLEISLASGQKDCLTSLRSGRQLLCSVRQPSFFPKTAGSETYSRKIKSFFTLVPSLGKAFLGRGNIYSPRRNWKKKHKKVFPENFINSKEVVLQILINTMVVVKLQSKEMVFIKFLIFWRYF